MPLDKKKLAIDMGKITLNSALSVAVSSAAHYGLDYTSNRNKNFVNEEAQFGLMLFGSLLLLKFFDYLYNYILPKNFKFFQNKNKFSTPGEVLGGIVSAISGAEIGKLPLKHTSTDFVADISTLTIPISAFILTNTLLKLALNDSTSHSKRFIAGSCASISILLSGIFLALRNHNSYIDNMSTILPFALALFLSSTLQVFLKETLPEDLSPKKKNDEKTSLLPSTEQAPILSSSARKKNFLLTMQDFVLVQNNFAKKCALLIQGITIIAEHEENIVLKGSYARLLAIINDEPHYMEYFLTDLFKNLNNINSFENFTTQLMGILSSEEFKTQLAVIVLITSKLDDLIYNNYRIKPECEQSNLRYKYESQSEAEYQNGNIYNNSNYGMQTLLMAPMQNLARYSLFIDKFLQKGLELSGTSINPQVLRRIEENLRYCQRFANKYTKKFNKIIGINATNPSLLQMSVVFGILDDKKSENNLLPQMDSMRREASEINIV